MMDEPVHEGSHDHRIPGDPLARFCDPAASATSGFGSSAELARACAACRNTWQPSPGTGRVLGAVQCRRREAQVELRDFLNAVRVRAWMVVVTAAIVTLVSVGVSLLQAPAYLGETQVLLTQQNTGTALLGSPQTYLTDVALEREIQTQVQAMQSRGLLEQVIQALGMNALTARRTLSSLRIRASMADG